MGVTEVLQRCYRGVTGCQKVVLQICTVAGNEKDRYL